MVFETFVLQGSPIALICLTLGNELVVPAVKFIFTCQIVGSTLLCKASKTHTTLAVSSTAVQPQSKGRPKNDAIQTRLKKNFTHSRRASQCLQVCQSDIEKCYNVQQKWKKKTEAAISRPCVAKAQASAASLRKLASVDFQNCTTLYLNWSVKWLPHTSVGVPVPPATMHTKRPT